jgi:hypothetical protein
VTAITLAGDQPTNPRSGARDGAVRQEVAALQTALAGIHAAVWGYGVVGPHLDDDAADLGRETYTTYLELRERLTGLLRARSTVPVAADPAYALPFAVTDAASARRLAIHLEDGCAGVFADLVAAAAAKDVRALAARLVRDCAERRVRWGARPVAFPGLPERR